MAVTYHDYNCGHPWYYLLGGAVQSPKAILAEAERRDFKGYREEEIRAADRKSEPQRSEALRELKEQALHDIRSDLVSYRKAARQLSVLRREVEENDNPSKCLSVHTSLSLKYCHLLHHLSHRVWIDELLAYQNDLFA
ncbi:hypothetical protein [uncultured Sneathiella sp.]|jgi:hypothetical protein|uniref:hypothetical protein n=1 Tax=uncultured Sneathiella sp. TaxID=879315 RepID=UPI0030DAA5F9|tara:strand:+ start:1683 stop:2096 length:414 start_codon:yes stop_codon:yes gene_type:complete